MFIKYDEYDLLELFQCEPVSISGDPDDGELIYVFQDDQQFKVILTLSVYRQTSDVSITYKEFVVFTGSFTNVTSIHRNDRMLFISVGGEEKLSIKFNSQVGVTLLNGGCG